MSPEDLEKLKKTNGCEKCDLSRANLKGADLVGTYLAGADLRNADLRGANLDGADLRHADLRGAYLGGVNLKEAFFCETTMPDGTKNNTDCP